MIDIGAKQEEAMIEGRYFPPGSSRVVAASLSGVPERLVLLQFRKTPDGKCHADYC